MECTIPILLRSRKMTPYPVDSRRLITRHSIALEQTHLYQAVVEIATQLTQRNAPTLNKHSRLNHHNHHKNKKKKKLPTKKKKTTTRLKNHTHANKNTHFRNITFSN